MTVNSNTAIKHTISGEHSPITITEDKIRTFMSIVYIIIYISVRCKIKPKKNKSGLFYNRNDAT